MSKQKFIILPEDAVPAFAEGCKNCELCAKRTRIIWGEEHPYALLDDGQIYLLTQFQIGKWSCKY